MQEITLDGTPTPATIADLRAADIYLDGEQPMVVLTVATGSAPAQVWAMANDSIQGVAADMAVLRVGRVPRVSRIDMKRSHGWLVRFYRGTDERRRLCSDRRYGNALDSLRAAVLLMPPIRAYSLFLSVPGARRYGHSAWHRASAWVPRAGFRDQHEPAPRSNSKDAGSLRVVTAQIQASSAAGVEELILEWTDADLAMVFVLST